MLLESLLAYMHFVAILGLVVFLTSEAALCRAEWMNAAIVHRLPVDRLYLVAAIAVLATGIARTWWGAKGFGWYWSQPLLHLKLTLFVVIGVMSAAPTRAFMRWRRTLAASGALPPAEEVAASAALDHDPGARAAAGAARGRLAGARSGHSLNAESGLLLFQALAHEGAALVALLALGVHVALLHLSLLRALLRAHRLEAVLRNDFFASPVRSPACFSQLSSVAAPAGAAF